MSVFVVRIDDMQALLSKWQELLVEDNITPVFTCNENALTTLDQWPRIKWFYYCDNQNGNTIRIYDTEHLNYYGGSCYLETNTWSKEHYERVVIRGKNMWAGDQANLKREQSLRNRFRRDSPWCLFSARRAPLRPEMQPPGNIMLQLRAQNPPIANIQANIRRDVRLWYFHGVNQLPSFTASQHTQYAVLPESALDLTTDWIVD